MAVRVNIQANILNWAIQRAGYNVPEFVANNPTIEKWLTGEKQPTVKQLEEFSRKVHLPFGYLFLNEPPKEKLPIPFFRSNGNRTDAVSLNVYDTVLLLQQRQDWLKNYLKDNGFEPLPFVGKFRDSTDVKAIAADIRQTLGLADDWASAYKTWQEAKDFLTLKIEDKGIITTFNGVVENNTHRAIPVDECRGFVLVDEYAPFMFVNSADWKAAQMFTIVHELAHIWTGQSAGFDFRQLQPANDPVELLCDRVAAEFLVPETAFNEIWHQHKDYKAVARYFKVSEIVAARRALDTGKISRADFFGFYNAYASREQSKKDNQSSGGDFYATAGKRVSLTFMSHIRNALKSGQLLYRDACKLTGFKGDTFEQFLSKKM